MSGHRLRQLDLAEFKCFESLRVPLGGLTILSGYNGAGKSTALQPLLLLAQAARRKTFTDGSEAGDLPLNGEIVKLGSAGDVIRAKSEGATCRFEISDGEKSLALTATGKKGARSLNLKKERGESWPELFTSLERLVHISAVRGGPMEVFPAPDRIAGQACDVGIDGRFAAYWYHELADIEVEEARRCSDEIATTFRKQLDAWLNRLAPGANANVQALGAVSMLALQFRLNYTGEWRHPANVGYGLSYSFPILVALLAAEAGDIVVIDSPEAHLHPQAQSRMGQMLATFASTGVQLIVETHSDHVLNGIRLATYDKVISADDLSLLFFSGSSIDGHGVTRPQINQDGRIDEWPAGFFDQSEKDISRLAGWN